MINQVLLHLIITNSLTASNYLNTDAYITYLQDSEDSVQCILKLLNKNVPCGAIISAITNDDDGEFNDELKAINNEICNSLITRSMLKQNWLIPSDVYLILIKETSELSMTLSELSRDLLWNPEAKCLLLIRNIIKNDINQIFHELLKHRIYNVLLLSNVDSINIQSYTYFPFDNNNCGKHFDEIVNLGPCTNVSIGNTSFLIEQLNKYHNCSIVVGIHEVVPYIITSANTDLNVSEEYKYGIEQLVLQSIAALEHVKIEYKFFASDIDRGVVLSNNTGTGILNYLQNGEISLAVGGFILILNRVSICDYIWGYNYADLKIVTPAATEIVWKKVYREFGIIAWILVASSFCVMLLITLLILTFSLNKRPDSINIMLKLLDYLLDHSDERLFNTKNMRLILLCWIWYTYFINSFYKTAYYSLITGHVKEKLDFEEGNLRTFPYDPCISDVGRSFFLYAYNLTFPYRERIEKCQSTDGSLDHVAERSDYYTVATEYAYFLKAPKYIDEDGNFKLVSWDILSGTISAFYCTRGFGLRERFQKHAMNIFESGLLQFRLNMMKVKSRHFTQNNKRYFKKLHFSDFRVSYCILIIGSIVSCFCFVLERYYYVP